MTWLIDLFTKPSVAQQVIAIALTASIGLMVGKIKVKGSGCIRTREHFLQLIDMGIDRMGVGYRSTSDTSASALKATSSTLFRNSASSSSFTPSACRWAPASWTPYAATAWS